MVDAGSDFAVPLYSGESNVAVGASSTPIHVAALVVQIGRGHWLIQESLHPRFPSPYTNSVFKTTLHVRRSLWLCTGSARERAADHVGELGFPIRLGQQQHAGVEAALMHDR